MQSICQRRRLESCILGWTVLRSLIAEEMNCKGKAKVEKGVKKKNGNVRWNWILSFMHHRHEKWTMWLQMSYGWNSATNRSCRVMDYDTEFTRELSYLTLPSKIQERPRFKLQKNLDVRALDNVTVRPGGPSYYQDIKKWVKKLFRWEDLESLNVWTWSDGPWLDHWHRGRKIMFGRDWGIIDIKLIPSPNNCTRILFPWDFNLIFFWICATNQSYTIQSFFMLKGFDQFMTLSRHQRQWDSDGDKAHNRHCITHELVGIKKLVNHNIYISNQS